LIDTHGRVRVAEFGLAKLVDDGRASLGLTQTDQVLGTVHYMAPEQLRGTRPVDHRADIYALGVVLYELLTGELPLGRFEPPSTLAEIPAHIDEVVLRCLASNPEARYASAADVARAIGASEFSAPRPTRRAMHRAPAPQKLDRVKRDTLRTWIAALIVGAATTQVWFRVPFGDWAKSSTGELALKEIVGYQGSTVIGPVSIPWTMAFVALAGAALIRTIRAPNTVFRDTPAIALSVGGLLLAVVTAGWPFGSEVQRGGGLFVVIAVFVVTLALDVAPLLRARSRARSLASLRAAEWQIKRSNDNRRKRLEQKRRVADGSN